MKEVDESYRPQSYSPCPIFIMFNFNVGNFGEKIFQMRQDLEAGIMIRFEAESRFGQMQKVFKVGIARVERHVPLGPTTLQLDRDFLDETRITTVHPYKNVGIESSLKKRLKFFSFLRCLLRA